jgi:hypothetical protein
MAMPSDELKKKKMFHFNIDSPSMTCFNYEKFIAKLSKTKSKEKENVSVLAVNLNDLTIEPKQHQIQQEKQQHDNSTDLLDQSKPPAQPQPQTMPLNCEHSKSAQFNFKEYMSDFVRSISYLSLLNLVYHANEPLNSVSKPSDRIVKELNDSLIFFKKQRQTFAKLYDLNMFLKKRVASFGRPIRQENQEKKSDSLKRISYLRFMNGFRSMIRKRGLRLKRLRWANFIRMVQLS